MNRTTLIALAGFCVLQALPASACDFEDADGPDVALVLSGGGAFTTTQVGALTVIEELGVPIHCVLGTSMGSVTGAMYVSGYSAEEIADIYRDRPWNADFRREPDRRDKSYLQKEFETQYFSDYFAGIGPDGVQLPGGLASMVGLQAAFRDVFAHIPNDIDFTTQLRVPYRSVAMNLSTGEAVAFDGGDLVQTILASMAVPALFAPRQIDGDYYVDGGMAAQLPVRLAKAMGADIVIAIDTTVEPSKIQRDPSLSGTTQQLVQITVYQNRQADVAALGAGDVLMVPDLAGLSTGNFNLVDEGVASGRAEADKFRVQLQEIARVAAPNRDRIMDPGDRLKPEGDLILVNESVIDDDVITRRLGFRDGDFDDRQDLDQRLRSLAAFGGFGDTDLSSTLDNPLLRVAPRSLGRTLLQAGFQASTTFDGDAQYALLGRISRRPVSRLGGEASLSLELGTDFGATAQYYQPLGREGRFFAVPVLSYRGEEVLFDIADTRLGEFFQQRGGVRLRLGRELGNWGILALEGTVVAGDIEPVVTVNPDVLQGNSYSQGGGGISFAVDTLNRAAWPTTGVRISATGELLFDLETGAETRKYTLFASGASKIGPFGLNFSVQAEGIEEENNEPVQILNLGGFRRLSAFTESSVPNDQYVLGTAEVFYRLTGTGGMLNFPVYVGTTLEYANIEFDVFQDGRSDDVFAGSIYLGADTILGPLYLGTGASDSGAFAVFLHYGRTF
ncbi:MAG: patatin-like phospholipase family protein [Pseudomonadota bacterium]